MIVYNVDQRWFVDKASAEAYRKSEGLKPAATLKVTVSNRLELATLLNMICDVPQVPAGNGEGRPVIEPHDASLPFGLTDAVVPEFIKKDWR